MEKKLNVAVIFGGKSGEHEVSLMSATNVINAMDKSKYNIYMLGITKKGVWMKYDGETEHIQDGTWEQMAVKLDQNHNIDLIFSNILNGTDANSIDVVFPVLHGPNGEDGTIQGLLEILDIPYVGCGVVASALGMDKAFSKILFKTAGLPIGPFEVIYKHKFQDDSEQIIQKIENNFTYPVFIKPANMGSSVGITKAHNRLELIDGIQLAFEYDRKVLVEAFIQCREIECAVLGNHKPMASGVGEILPSHEFYDYKAKYFDDGQSILVIPAQIDEEKSEEIRDIAIKAYEALDCSGMARVDFFLEKATNKVYLNELNTIPGFTQISMYPKLWEAAGLSYSCLIDKLIQLAIERHIAKTL